MTTATASAPRALDDGWATSLRELLATIATEFNIVELRDEATIGSVRQTGFAHTQREGVICLAVNRDYFARASANPYVCAIIAPPAVVAASQSPPGKAVVVSTRAEELYLYLHAEQVPNPSEDVLDIHPSAVIDASAVLRGHVQIDAGVTVGPRAVISGPAIIHAGVQLEPGVIVGCDGLYAKIIRGRRLHMPHFGGVEIGEEAFLHAGAVIVRSALRGEATRIGKAAHIGVMTNIGHDVVVDDLAAISSNCVIAGRAHVGRNAWIGASAVVSNAIRIGAGAKVRLGAVVIRDVPDNASVSGNFAIDHSRSLRKYSKEIGA